MIGTAGVQCSLCVPRFARGRRYRSRLDPFWRHINWQLPDTALARIWEVDRANLRARRVRLAVGRPRWGAATHRRDPVFLAAVAVEQAKARRWGGTRPSHTRRDCRPLSLS